jgi:hypothetical protein
MADDYWFLILAGSEDDLAGFHALGANKDLADLAVFLNPPGLQIRLKQPLSGAGNLNTDTAGFFGKTSAGN